MKTSSATLVGGFTFRTSSVLPPSFVRLADLAPGIVQRMVYASAGNFTGRPVAGYECCDCWLHEETARVLARVAARAGALGYTLVVYDGYRPQRASDEFCSWAVDLRDDGAKSTYYPGVEKYRLFADGYIGLKSHHSTGFAVDIGLLHKGGDALDFGTSFDVFDPRSATEHPAIDGVAKTNRLRLVSLMESEGFENYPREWWHFSLRGSRGAPGYDLPIRRPRHV